MSVLPENSEDRKTVYGGEVYLNEVNDKRDMEKFLEDNNKAGLLKVSVTTGRGAVPIADSRLYVTKMIDGDRVIFHKGIADKSGDFEDVVLPAPSMEGSFKKDGTLPYEVYDVKIERPNFETVYIYGIPVYEGIKSIQNADMIRKGK